MLRTRAKPECGTPNAVAYQSPGGARLYGPGADLRCRFCRLSVRPARLYVADQRVPARWRQFCRPGQIPARLFRPQFLEGAVVHRQIHRDHYSRTDGPRLRPGVADGTEPPDPAVRPGRHLHARGHWPRDLELAVVLAVRPAGRPV